MDTDACNYLLHSCSYNSVALPCPRPLSRLLRIEAGSSDPAGAPHPHVCIHPLFADPTPGSVYHAIQPPIQPGREKEKEIKRVD